MPLDKDTQKQAVKEAIKEWLDSSFASFGRWSFYSIVAMAFAGLVFLALKGQGWNK